MKKVALRVEHKFKNRVVGVHILEGPHETISIGSAATAKIRVLGDEINGLHAALDCADDKWRVCDLGSKSGTWINQKPIVECEIEKPVVIHIGNHQLKATPHLLERHLFDKDVPPTKGQVTYHQAVVLKKGLLHESVLLAKGEAFTPSVPGLGTFPSPKDSEWVETKNGDYTIKQRLAKSNVVQDSSMRDIVGEDWKRPAPIVGVLMALFMIIGVMLLMPHKPEDQLKTEVPTNQFTRMIFDGKKVRKQKAVAEKMRKSMQGQSKTGVAKSTPGGDAGTKRPGGTKSTPGVKVVTNLKNSNLGALIGRVAARAAKDALLVQGAGQAAGSRNAGRALSIGGGTSLDKIGGGAGGGDTMRVGGLGTAGKGGGSSGYKGTGALSLGNIGNAQVGVVDEETEVEGGLDKEAIARVIRAQLGQIRYCYERQLSANPDLYGKILVKFTIGAAGSVVAQAIGSTSLNNAMVEGCILRRIAGWQFPTPRGGTNVMVTYPFLFKSTR